MSDHQRVLVTGGGGFLGGYICSHFRKHGYQVMAVGRFKEQPKTEPQYTGCNCIEMSLPDSGFSKLLQTFRPELLVHCAGTSSVDSSVADPYTDFYKNTITCAFTLEMLRQATPECRFLFLSSAAVYGNPSRLPISEQAPCRPISPYGYHKLLCEQMVQEYSCLYGLRFITARLFSAYGEGLRRQILYDLCCKFKSMDAVEVYGTGAETRDFIHAADVAASLMLLHEEDAAGVFNVASGEQTTVSSVVEELRQGLQSSQPLFYSGTNKPGNPLHWQADTTRLKTTGFKISVPLREGIEHYCHWFITAIQ